MNMNIQSVYRYIITELFRMILFLSSLLDAILTLCQYFTLLCVTFPDICFLTNTLSFLYGLYITIGAQ